MDSQEIRLDKMAKGQVARMVGSEIGDYAYAREAEILTRLVQAYRSGKLTHETALGGIAEIAALRGLMTNITRDVQAGIKATEQEVNRPG